MTITDISVVIPSWDWQRSLSRVRGLRHMEQRKRAEYIIVIPKAETAYELQPDLSEWLATDSPEGLRIIETDTYLSPVEAMALAGEHLLSPEESKRGPGYSPSDIFAFLHDDVLIEERGWDRTIIDHFTTHPRCGLAGFGGAIGFGHADIYKVPYHFSQLARVDFVSNMREAHQHGRRVREATRVAALDGFALITTREFYDRSGRVEDVPFGLWNECLEDHICFHMYDGWISCRAAELGFETWMLPIACHHQGGQTSVVRQADYERVVARLGFSSSQDLYDQAHRRVYDRFHNVLPIRIEESR